MKRIAPVLSCFVLLALLVLAPDARAQVDPVLSIAASPASGTYTLVSPNGVAIALAKPGSEIVVRVRDPFGVPITGLVADDFEVDGFPLASMSDASFGPAPPGPKNVASVTVIGPGDYRLDGRIYSGGCGREMIVKVRGVVINSGVPVPNPFNSVDLNGDGTSDLVDVGAFSGIFFGGAYDPCIDLAFDGVINIADIGEFALGLGAAFPVGAVLDID